MGPETHTHYVRTWLRRQRRWARRFRDQSLCSHLMFDQLGESPEGGATLPPQIPMHETRFDRSPFRFQRSEQACHGFVQNRVSKIPESIV